MIRICYKPVGTYRWQRIATPYCPEQLPSQQGPMRVFTPCIPKALRLEDLTDLVMVQPDCSSMVQSVFPLPVIDRSEIIRISRSTEMLRQVRGGRPT